MEDILVEFDKYIAANKDILSVLPTNTKKNKKIYSDKLVELLDAANKIKVVIWNEIETRYNDLLNVEENPKIAEYTEIIKNHPDVELFNELNTPFEKLGIDRICHSLSCFFEADLYLVNENIQKFVEIFKDYGIILTADDFKYSESAHDYMKVYFEEAGDLNSDRLKQTFEQIYWKCPDIVTHIELNIRYLYSINSKRIEKELNERNQRTLDAIHLDKNGLVKQYFELNKSLIKAYRVDPKAVFDKFYSGEWKIKDFDEKQMSVLYDKYSSRPYFELNEDERAEIDNNFGKLLNTLQEYDIFVKYKYILDDLKTKFQNKDSFKDNYDKKLKELRTKEQELLKENKKYSSVVKVSKNPLLRLFKKKFDRKIYEYPVKTNIRIKELKLLYTALDEENVNQRIIEFVDEGCTLKYMFKIAISYYTYVYKLIKDVIDEDMNPDHEVVSLEEFIDQPYKVMLNNIKLVEIDDIKQIIASRYKILSIKIEQEDLNEENIDELVRDIEKIVNYYNIRRSGLNIDDISYIERVKSIIDRKK